MTFTHLFFQSMLADLRGRIVLTINRPVVGEGHPAAASQPQDNQIVDDNPFSSQLHSSVGSEDSMGYK